MKLSPEERRRIYEEERARLESEEGMAAKQDSAPRTSLKPNAAGLLCYLGAWVSGVIFLIIERKNRIVRFHAMQSLITFGILSIVIAIADGVRDWVILGHTELGWLFYPQLIAANLVFGVVLAISIILWVVLMYQTYHSRYVKLPLFGDLARKLISRLDGIKKEDLEPPPPQAKGVPITKDSPRPHLESTRDGRIAPSVAAIVWSAIFLVFFNFFSEYFAFYSREAIAGVTRWNMYPLLTQDLSLVMPILNITLILSIVGHSIAIAWDRYLVRQITLIVLSVLGMVTVLTFLRVFPFDFSVIPHDGAAAVFPMAAIVVMILITVGLGISALVRFIKLIINVTQKHDGVATPPA